jgi:probable rRNA maturation factor
VAINVVVSPKYARRISQKELRAAAVRTLAAERTAVPVSLSIVVVGDRAMRDYNRRFHQINTATDVLSFSNPNVDYLGDIIISYETAKANARRAGWRIRDELQLLVTHGILHLLGYEDETESARLHMWQRQADILGQNAARAEFGGK